jgi:hypothetical protein
MAGKTFDCFVKDVRPVGGNLVVTLICHEQGEEVKEDVSRHD